MNHNNKKPSELLKLDDKNAQFFVNLVLDFVYNFNSSPVRYQSGNQADSLLKLVLTGDMAGNIYKTSKKVPQKLTMTLVGANISMDNFQRILTNMKKSFFDKIKEDEDNTKKVISFTKDVLPNVIPLACILTVKNKNKDFVKMLCDIKENREIKKLKNDIEKLKNRLNKKETVKSSTNICLDQKDNKLFEECVATLVALGYKKKAAKIEVEKYFQSKTASSAEEFINTFF